MVKNCIHQLALGFFLGLIGNAAAVSKTIYETGSAYEANTTFRLANRLDFYFLAALKSQGISPAKLASDEIFFRRIYLDISGALPDSKAVETFLANRNSQKRAKIIDTLLASDGFANYWTLKWCDVLRVKAEYPINLWPNAVQAYHRWIRDAIRTNMSYDQFAWELLTRSGSNFRVPQVNFYRAVEARTPSDLAVAVGLTFMGTRLEKWPLSQRQGMEAFFSQITYKTTGEWKEEIVIFSPTALTPPQSAVFPDGSRPKMKAGTDPRTTFAHWLINKKNPWFARAMVNRIWAWIFGQGLIHEADDLRKDNPAVLPQVLQWLEHEFIRSHYDTRHLLRVIFNSHLYQQSPFPLLPHDQATMLFAHYPARRLDAELLIDAINTVTGTTESYSSIIPEPFTFVPNDQRTVELADGSISSAFLELFGRPARDTGLLTERNQDPTFGQRLHLLNSSHIQRKIEKSPVLAEWISSYRGDRKKIIHSLYLRFLSRLPTDEECQIALTYFKNQGLKPRQAIHDLAWALINSKEFLYQH